MRTLLRLAWRNLWRHRARTILMVGIVFFATFLILLLWSLTAGIFDSLIRTNVELDYGAIKIFPVGYRADPAPTHGFSEEILEQVLTLAREETRGRAAARLVFNGLLRSAYGAKGVVIRGVDLGSESKVTRLGEAVVAGRYLASSGEALLGVRIAHDLDVRVGERVVVLAQGAQGTRSRGFVVVGIIESGLASLDERTVLIPLSDAQALVGFPGATEVVLGLPWGVEPEAVAETLAEKLEKVGAACEVLTFAQGNPLIAGVIAGNTGEMVVYMLLFGVLAGFGVANTILFSVIERTRELGVMAALGMSPRRVASMVVLEAVLVSLLGFAAAAIVSYPIILLLSRVGIPFGSLSGLMSEIGIPPRWYASARGWYWAASLVVVVATGVVAAWYPARRAAKLEPVEAIRDV